MFLAAAVAVWVVGTWGHRGPVIAAAQRQMINELESVLLHNTTSPQYGRIDDPHDGRGFVAGIGDFTTADGGVVDVVEEFGARVPANPLTTYLPVLRNLALQTSAAVTELSGFADAWRAAGTASAFRQAQDAVMARRYFEPALARAQLLGEVSPLGVAILYDTVIQHGLGPDPDGLDALVARTDARVNRPGSEGSRGWLDAFLVVRTGVLSHPADVQHAVAWPSTVERPRVLAGLLRSGADDLVPPLPITAWGRSHVLDSAADKTGEPSILTAPSAAVPTSLSTSLSITASPSGSARPSTSGSATARATAGTQPKTPPIASTGSPPKPPIVHLHYAGFSGSTGLRLNGIASVTGGRLFLAGSLEQAGSAWSATLIDPTASFTTSFEVLIASVSDGMAFVVQSQGPTALGQPGGSLGYGSPPPDSGGQRIYPSVEVEIDPWDNSVDGFDPPGHPHIALMTNGNIVNHLFWADPGFNLYGNPVHLWLTYNASVHTLVVYAGQSTSRPAAPMFTATVNLAAVVGSGRAYVGFTAGTGQIYAAESVGSWDFNQG